MDLLLNKYKYSQQQQMQHYNNKRNAAVQTSPLLNPSKANSNPSFTGSFSNRFSQLNIKEIIEKIDNVLGDNFFSKTLEKTEIAEKLDDLKLGDFDKLETSILRDAGRTISYPFKNLWLD